MKLKGFEDIVNFWLYASSIQRPSSISCSTCTFRTILWLKEMAESYISNGIHREKLSISSNAWHLSNTWRWLNPCGMWGWDVSLKFLREARVEGRCTDSFLDRLTIAIPARTWNEKVYHAFAIVSEMNHSCLVDWKRKYVSPWNIITYNIIEWIFKEICKQPNTCQKS
jgi:hypothetical protein